MSKRLTWLWLATTATVLAARQSMTPFPSSLGNFLIYAFVHWLAVAMVAVIAAGCISSFNKFWLKGSESEQKSWVHDEALYAAFMTIMVFSIFLIVASSSSGGDPDR